MDDFDDIMASLRSKEDDKKSPKKSQEDDDLFTLLGSSDLGDEFEFPEDDELFGTFTEPAALGFDEADLGALESLPIAPLEERRSGPASRPVSPSPAPPQQEIDKTAISLDTTTDVEGVPSWMRQLQEREEEEERRELVQKSAPARPETRGAKKKTKKRTRQRAGMFLGMTPQQRMILSIFLFLDVSVLGCLFLLAIEAISF